MYAMYMLSIKRGRLPSALVTRLQHIGRGPLSVIGPLTWWDVLSMPFRVRGTRRHDAQEPGPGRSDRDAAAVIGHCPDAPRTARALAGIRAALPLPRLEP